MRVADLQIEMREYQDVGVALVIQRAIGHAMETKGITHETKLTSDSLEAIRQSIYDLNDASRGNVDPMERILNAMFSQHSPSGSGNAVEDALQYIERLREETVRN